MLQWIELLKQIFLSNDLDALYYMKAESHSVSSLSKHS